MLRKDELGIGANYIYQDTDSFCMGTDAVLLYGLLPRKNGRVADICSGNGAVALLTLAGGKAERVTAVEIHPDACKLAAKSAAENGLSERLEIINGDICKIKEILPAAQYDALSVNPPYFKVGSGLLPPDPALAACRHETQCGIADVFAAAEYLLRKGGRLYMVHRTERQAEILQEIQKYDFSVSRTVTVFSRPGRPARIFLLEAVKGVEISDVKQECFTVQNANGSLSERYKSILKE